MIDMELLFLKTITLSKKIQCPTQNAWLSLLICLQGSIFEWEKKHLFACWGPVAFTKPKKEDWGSRALSAVVQLNPKKQSFV